MNYVDVLEIVSTNAVIVVLLAAMALFLCKWVDHPRIQYWMWMLVMLKLVTPPIYTVTLPWRHATRFQPRDVATEETVAATPEPSLGLGRSSQESFRLDAREGRPESREMLPIPPADHETTQAVGTKAPQAHFPWLRVVFSLYALGAVSLLLMITARSYRLRNLLCQNRSKSNRLTQLVSEIAPKMGLGWKPRVYEVRSAIPPMVWWQAWKPEVYLSSDLLTKLTDQQLRGVMAHELAHCRRGDYRWRWVQCAVLVLYWWHPLAWMAVRRVQAAEERCCDAIVVGLLPERIKDYARGLLHVVDHSTFRYLLSLEMALSSSQELTHRIKDILERRNADRPGKRLATLALAGVAILSFNPAVLLTLTAAQRPDVTVKGEDEIGLASYDALPVRARLRVGSSRFRPASSIGDLAISPDGDVLVSSGAAIQAWNAETGELKWSASFADHLSRGGATGYGGHTIVFASDMANVYTPGGMSQFISWDLDTGKPVVTEFLEGFEHAVPAAPEEKGALDTRIPKAIDVSADGKLVALCSSLGIIIGDTNGLVLTKLENRPTEIIYGHGVGGHDRLTYGGHYAAAKFSPDSNLLAVVTSDSPDRIRLLDTDTFEVVNEIKLTSWLVRMDFSPYGERLVATERDAAVRAYRTEDGKGIWERKIELSDLYENYLSQLRHSPDGHTIAVGATDESIYLLDAETGEVANKLVGHSSYPWALVYSPDGQVLYSSGWDKMIRRWDTKSGRQLELASGIHATGLTAASPDSEVIAVAEDRGRVHVFDASNGQPIHCLDIAPHAMSFSPDGELFAAGGRTDDFLWLSIWGTNSFERLHRWEWPRGADLNTDVQEIAFNPSNTRVAAVVFRQGKTHLWSLESGELISELRHGNVYGVSFSPTEDQLVTGGWDSRLRFWDSNTGAPLETINLEEALGERPRVQIYHVSYSPDGRFVAAGHGLEVSLWDTQSLGLRNQFKYHPSGGWGVGDLSFSPDGLWLCTGEMSRTIKIWDPYTGQKALDVGEHGSRIISSVGFGARGGTLLSGAGDGVCYVWDIGRSDDFQSTGLEQLWTHLSGEDAELRFKAYWEFSRRGDDAVALLENKLRSAGSIFDEYEIMRAVDEGSGSRRLQMLNKLVSRDSRVLRSTSVRCAMSLFDRINSERSRRVLSSFAESASIQPAISAEARRIQDQRKANSKR